MDGAFTCDCEGTKYTGDNCETAQGDTTAAMIGAVLGVVVLGAAVIFLLLKWQRYTRSMMATDFFEQLQAMKDRGEMDEAQAVLKGSVPRELKRGWLALIDKLGHGQFGDVWKGLLTDSDNAAVPEYMVACKVVKEASGSLDRTGFAAAEEELLKEALLMAQVETHPHLVSLVGVITRGNPKVLVLSFCEHGELQGALKKRAADGDAFSTAAKLEFCLEVADGMAHLAKHNFVHRDLAARNVLLGTGMVCKVADFGLSRRVQTEDNTGDYYRSSSGIIPVRWTAPEGMTSQKFSSASDVWSYGITCVEIFQDGGHPYPGIKSNPEVIKAVCTQGQVHQRPEGCGTDVYAELVKCWGFDPLLRPEFADLKGFFERATTQASANPGDTDQGGSKQALWGDAGSSRYDLGHQDANNSSSVATDAYLDVGSGTGTTNTGQSTANDGPGPASASQQYDLGHKDAQHSTGEEGGFGFGDQGDHHINQLEMDGLEL